MYLLGVLVSRGTTMVLYGIYFVDRLFTYTFFTTRLAYKRSFLDVWGGGIQISVSTTFDIRLLQPLNWSKL